MPCFVFTSPADRAGQAILCDPGPLGHPDRKTDVPVKVAITETHVTVDDEQQPRRIISSTGVNGVVTYLVDGSSAGLIQRERRMALEQAYTAFERLMANLMPLKEGSECPGLITAAIGELHNWFSHERERLAGGGRAKPIIARRETR